MVAACRTLRPTVSLPMNVMCLRTEEVKSVRKSEDETYLIYGDVVRASASEG